MMTHLYREFRRPDPHGPGRAICWCGWTSQPCWLEIRGRAEYDMHLAQVAVAASFEPRQHP